ncbi:TetR/AcrR family transcriptional regulator [Frankia sp. CNm7]|uniref:TetR/AcrR family transcriptional regulator n=1 Tax=Frankia nepalensis TaxID=1836974 RepID=A0A937UL58_9ACTN|nr:TetR family transcriptional regulator [Frankia nepalensis]MBL7502390.1 TetR/AcrR family transcriptional regulator [Frankia nepalensis]MBL7516215.1 TetR/AcrR family transcriptional regulator [Frankia nepalensis]MBL7518509.1 TetR/AcrR family transcriptional regulator [Frankia nepalensis]MBL7625693.1 TetR/AcrR family transcriptional regulator [Frankia nepalensis]
MSEAVTAAATPPAKGVAAATATPSQQARRERMLTAALSLASQGGYDEVQMREVAEQAGVALGTLYRYFPSKVHLLASALARHLAGVRDAVLAQPSVSDDPATRVLAMMNRLVDELSRDRLVAEALVQAMTLASATVGTEIDDVDDAMTTLIGVAAFGPDHVVDERDKLTTNIIGKVFLSDLRYWLGDRMTLEGVRASLADTVAVVLAGQGALGGSPVAR